MSKFEHLIDRLSEEAAARILRLEETVATGTADFPPVSVFTNCHIHTEYSFSPYTPAEAALRSKQAGLATTGIMDHDSVSGAYEFIAAGAVLDIPVTVGCECRLDMRNTPLAGRRINNPDQLSVAYSALHGIPHQHIATVDAFFAPYREKRGQRNRAMCVRLNALLAPFGLALDYDTDVLPLSRHKEGGSVTERHILFALSKKLIDRFPVPEELVSFLEHTIGISVSAKVRGYLLTGDPQTALYAFDLLGALKSALVDRFYIDAEDELPDVREYIRLANEIGAIPAYAYLGDVTASVTGDKKPQKFEDDYLGLLFDTLRDLGYRAVTYMPSRNTPEQLDRIMAMCHAYRFFEISGEDINTPRQSFLCEALAKPECAHLADSAFALIAHERAATEDPDRAFFSLATESRIPDLYSRIKLYAEAERS